MSEANKRQPGGEHYLKHGDLQPWDVVAHFGLDFFQGNIVKYVIRWKDKAGIQDLEKAMHYLEKYLEIQKQEIVMGLEHSLMSDNSAVPSNLEFHAGPAEPIPPTAMPSDVYLDRLERLVMENARLRACLGEALGVLRRVSMIEDSGNIESAAAPTIKTTETILGVVRLAK